MDDQSGDVMSNRIKDLTGKKFNRLTVLRFSHSKNKKSYWECVCSCGVSKAVRSDRLTSGGTKSCGCAQREIAGRQCKHGLVHTQEYNSWRNMKERCNNKNNPNYKDYGGRNIKITASWDDFRLFYSDMGKKPSNNHTIERVDNNKGYEPTNCVWATKKQQANNRRSNVLLTHNGETKNITQWCEKLGFSKMLIRSRLNRGWSEEKTLTTPVIKKKPSDFNNTLWES